MRRVPVAVLRPLAFVALAAVLVPLAAGCGGGGGRVNTAPASTPTTPAEPPPPVAQPPVAPAPQTVPTDDRLLSTGWKYRFDMISPPNSNFGVTNRRVYLYFRPDTSSVGFQLENRLGVPIQIYWDECTFLDIYGRSWKAVHRGANYQTKDLPQEVTYVQPGAKYADFLIPVDLLNTPDAASGRGTKLLLPTDLGAQSLVGKIFGPTLVLGVESGEREVFEVRFKVASVYQDR